LGAVVTGPSLAFPAIETDGTRTGNTAMISNGMPCYFIVLSNSAIPGPRLLEQHAGERRRPGCCRSGCPLWARPGRSPRTQNGQ